MNTAKWLA